MKLPRVIFLITVCVLLTSCKPQYVRQGLKQIDSLSVTLDTVRMQLESIDSTEIKSKFELYQESILKVKAFEDNQYSDEEWSVMTQYGQIRKPMRNYIRKMPDFYRELSVSEKQLEDLRFDLVKKYINQEQFQDYIAREKIIIGNFVETFSIFYSLAAVQLTQFDSLYPKMNIIIENHSNKSNQ